MIKKQFLFICIVFSSFVFGQTTIEKNDKHLKEKVNGFVVSGNTYYLITDDGYIKVEQSDDPNDQWDEYYKKVYGDSVKNPNTIIQPQVRGYWPFRYFHPIIPLNDWIDQKWGFGGNMYLYDFIRIDMNGNYEFRPGVVGIIGGLDRIPEVDLPLK